MLLAFSFSLLISLIAWRARALSRSGALAACVVGTLIFGCGGLRWALILLAFFISSSLLSRLFKSRKHAQAEVTVKGSQRDAGQVLANGGTAALLAALYATLAAQPPAFNEIIWAAFCASLAAVNADTWATEIGVLSRVPPRLITTLKPVEPGASGGITPAGTLAAAGGALFIAALGVWLAPPGVPASAPLLIIIALCGFSGSLVDSLLGAALQALYICPTCAMPTEQHPTHTCGSPTTHLRGWRWLDNDRVNLVCALAAALLAAGMVIF